jgi:Ca-activated chloride channel family protein
MRDSVNSNTSTALSLAWVILALVAGRGWSIDGLPQTPQFKSGVNTVEVYAAVVGPDGRPVSGLTRDDFTVFDDGRPQAVTTFAEADFPLSVAIGIDRSFSMTTRLPTAKSGARTFLGQLRPDDQAMLVAIGSAVDTIAPLSTGRDAQFSAVDSLQPWGTTGLHDAIIQSIDAIQAARGRRALVLLSDGQDRYSQASADAAIEHARRSDVMIYPVALGGRRPELFADLAALTGGRSFNARTAADVDTAMRAVAAELHHQYLLGYAPSRAIVAGRPEWRTIQVRVREAGVTVRTRAGYMAQ